MNFATVTPTIDAPEVLQLLLCFVAFVGWVYLVRQSWGELKWSIEDHVSFMRWLGISRFATVFLYGVAVGLMFLNILVQLAVPSAINVDETTLDVVASLVQRLTSTLVAGVFCLVMLIDHVLRNRARFMRENTVVVPASAVAPGAAVASDDVAVIPTTDQTEGMVVPQKHQPPGVMERAATSEAPQAPLRAT
jgi:hypothetical protein